MGTIAKGSIGGSEKDVDKTQSPVQQKIVVPPWASLASGAASGLASCLLLQPMDLLKTRMQQEQQKERNELKANGTKTGSIPHNRGGPRRRTQRLVGLTKQVIRDDGWLGLWRGTVPTVAR